MLLGRRSSNPHDSVAHDTKKGSLRRIWAYGWGYHFWLYLKHLSQGENNRSRRCTVVIFRVGKLIEQIGNSGIILTTDYKQHTGQHSETAHGPPTTQSSLSSFPQSFQYSPSSSVSHSLGALFSKLLYCNYFLLLSSGYENKAVEWHNKRPDEGS